MINFPGVSLPFNVSDLVGSGSALFGQVGGFVLLALAFYFAPMLLKAIIYAINTQRSEGAQEVREYWRENTDRKTYNKLVRSHITSNLKNGIKRQYED